jgi:uncharacterized C2H2 Zn-finger protein
MVEYNCEKCLKKFDRKDSYQKHINRKYPCISNEISNIKDDKIDQIEKQIAKLTILIERLLLDKSIQ